MLVSLVGVGSAAFHATLLHSMQLMDEIPMLLLVCQIAFCLLEPVIGYPMAFFFCLCMALISSISYIYVDNPIVHQTLFGSFVLLITATMYLRTKRQLVIRKLSFLSLQIFIMAFIAWNLDNLLCPQLQLLKNNKFVAPLLELHAWWHLLSAYSLMLFLKACILLESATAAERQKVE